MGFGRICAGTSIVVLLVMVSVACDNGRGCNKRVGPMLNIKMGTLGALE